MPEAIEPEDPLYDTHAHFFTSDIEKYPVTTTGAREGEDNLKKRIASDPVTPENTLPLWRELGVVGGAGVQYNTVYKTDNSYVMDVSDQYPAEISSVVILHADAPETPKLLEKLILERKVSGLRLYGRQGPEGQTLWLDSPEARRTWEVAERYRLNVALMYSPQTSFASALPRIASMSKEYSGVNIVLDHCGWPAPEPSILGLTEEHRALAKRANIYLKLTTINFYQFKDAGIDAARFLRKAVDIYGADRIMWGSDLGNTLEDYAQMTRRARDAAALLTAQERRLVLCDTGRRMFSRAGR